MTRDLMGRLHRRSWLVSKERRYLDAHLALFTVHRNYIRSWRNGERETPAMMLMVPVGAMAESPAGALDLEEWLRVADFASIGCNDLMQCLFAADRQALAQRVLTGGTPAARQYIDHLRGDTCFESVRHMPAFAAFVNSLAEPARQ